MNDKPKLSNAKRKHALIACGYGLVLGLYFGLIIGFRINPDFLDHQRELLYFTLVVVFAVGLHANRKLNALTAWIAYLVCCVTFIASAILFDRSNIIELPSADLSTQAIYLFGTLMALGPVAHGLGWALKQYALPTEENTERWFKTWSPWLPMVVMLTMTIHTVEHVKNYGEVRVDRHGLLQRNESLGEMVIAFASGGIQKAIDDDSLRITLSISGNQFDRIEDVVAVVVIENHRDKKAPIPFRGPMNQWVVVLDQNGKQVPSKIKSDPLKDTVSTVIHGYKPVPPHGRQGFILPLHQWFKFESSTPYAIHLRWQDQLSEPLKFNVGPKPEVLSELESFIRKGPQAKPRDVVDSELIGLTEAAILARHNWRLFEVDRKNPDQKYFVDTDQPLPYPNQDVFWFSTHVLIFVNGKVVKHQRVDRSGGCIYRTPAYE